MAGAPVKLRTNYFTVETKPNAEIFRYVVTVANLDTKQNRKKRHIIELLLDNPVFLAARPALATDFNGLIVTARKLNLERTRDAKDFQDFEILYKVRLMVSNTKNCNIWKSLTLISS